MGFVFENPPTVAGTVLIIERIESQNYDAGVSGWAIMADGSAEFANLVARGSLIGGLVEINGTSYPNAIALFTDNPSEVEPATIEPSGSVGNHGVLELNSPKLLAAITPPAKITLNGYDDGHGTVEVDTDDVRITASDTITVESGSVLRFSNDFSTYTRLISGVFQNEGAAWASIPLAGTWVGVSAQYYKDPSGRVQLRGQVSGGGTTTIGTLPAGFRPTLAMEWIMRGVGGVIMCAVSISTAGVLTVTANAATAQASGVRLDSISFPTF